MHPLSNTPFFLGVNYPWRNYGQDFGRAGAEHCGISLTPAQEQVGRDFKHIAETGAMVVRWFLFGDGRGGFASEGEIPRKPDQFLFADVAAALQLAQRYNLKLCFSLIDYHWLQEHPQNQNAHPNRRVLHFAAGREAFLQNVLIPLFREFRGHPALFAWEIANEPEWTIREFQSRSPGKLHYADFRAYAGEIARAVHEYAGVPATLASARLLWVRAWTELGLDYYQAHYYPAAEEETKRDLAQQLMNLPPLDKPLWMGELPARDPAHPRYSLHQSLELCRSAGLCGAAVWRWTEPESQGTDVAIGRVDPAELKAWSASERSEGQRA
ncbi:MAG TPA: hypothetical protein VED65_00735 [Candidatus Bathyarchaeia archaeon]|nr:hypothetical protein [Candidatus Bathyarchaeia archaeon]